LDIPPQNINTSVVAVFCKVDTHVGNFFGVN